ncbi:carboxypeptidase regulatory-like domain-containing protein [Shewanella sp. Scap07]|uniref:carboxypeptidase regulatory-like domain-containing protein n=1 Tax=Shewanella sp. Scap07 TaxID=2589987 RepID=UPI0015B943A9|nr:carboxypeptidase regulatory-like domain-containing protein [Shewanella sp. Scap07]QLE85672.1 carboxypeptidase regulatory-like domain-containing protein [Shewanella sp. Scap07]
MNKAPEQQLGLVKHWVFYLVLLPLSGLAILLYIWLSTATDSTATDSTATDSSVVALGGRALPTPNPNDQKLDSTPYHSNNSNQADRLASNQVSSSQVANNYIGDQQAIRAHLSESNSLAVTVNNNRGRSEQSPRSLVDYNSAANVDLQNKQNPPSVSKIAKKTKPNSHRFIQGEMIEESADSSGYGTRKASQVTRAHIQPAHHQGKSEQSSNNNVRSIGAAMEHNPRRCNRIINRHYQTQPTADEQFLISQLRYGSDVLSEELFAYQHGSAVYLPLQLLAELLMLPIAVDMDGLSVNGWFKDEQAVIDISNGLMRYQNHSTLCESADTTLFYDDWDVYLPLDVVQQMFGLKIDFQANRQRFVIEHSDAVPLSQLRERQKRYQLFNAQKSAASHQQVVEIPKQNAILGDLAVNMDVGINANNQGGETQLGQEVSLQAKSELLHHQAYVSYSHSDSGDNVTAFIEKRSPDDWVKHYRLGTVNSQSLPLLSDGDQGLGVTLSAGDGITQDLRYITVEGEWLSDWDVELYRNNALVNVQRIAQDGLYRFEQVPYFIGLNQYQLRFFGPNGETKVENFSKLLDDSVLEQGDSGVQVGALAREQDDLQQYYISGQYALTDSFTAGLAIVRQQLDDDQWLTIPKLSMNLLGENNLLQINYANSGEGHAIGATLQGSIESVDWIADWSHFDDFESWDNPQMRLNQQANLSLNGSFANTAMSWSLGGDWRDYLLSSDSLQANARLSSQLGRLSMSGELRWLQSGGIDEYISRLAISGKLGQWYLRSYLDIGLGEGTEVDIWVANANRTIGERLNYQVEMRYHPQTSAQYSIRNALSYLFDYGTLRFMVDADDEGDWFGQLKWNSSALWYADDNLLLIDSQNYLNTGAVKLVVFQDDNGNNHLDESEHPIEGVRFSGHSQAELATNAEGELLINQLRVGQPHKLMLNEGSLPDPFLVARTPIFSVNAQPGHVQQIMYPVVNTAEIEGIVIVSGNSPLPAKGKLVELVALQTNDYYKTRVEFDGVFLFDAIVPGRYELRVASEDAIIVDIQPGEFLQLAPIKLSH